MTVDCRGGQWRTPSQGCGWPDLVIVNAPGKDTEPRKAAEFLFAAREVSRGAAKNGASVLWSMGGEAGAWRQEMGEAMARAEGLTYVSRGGEVWLTSSAHIAAAIRNASSRADVPGAVNEGMRKDRCQAVIGRVRSSRLGSWTNTADASIRRNKKEGMAVSQWLYRHSLPL